MVPEISSTARNQRGSQALVLGNLGEKAMRIGEYCGTGRDEK
jgi:hypothetical protein